MKLYILKYNNYFNRKLLKLEKIADYADYIVLTADNISFNPNDGRQTNQILNKYESGDYLVCTETKDNVETIVSRWFILEANRTRQGQYNLSLKRDVLADNLESIETAPIFVEKAMLKDSDKMIINNEGMQFNQIKSNETLLKDKSKVAWLVGYLAKNFNAIDTTAQTIEYENKEVSIKADKINKYYTFSQIAADTGISESLLASNLVLPGETHGSKSLRFTNYFKFECDLDTKSSGAFNHKADLFIENDFTTQRNKITGLNVSTWKFLLVNYLDSSNNLLTALGNSFIANKNAIINELKIQLNRDYYITKEQYLKLRKYDGTYILYLGKYYTLNITAVKINDTVSSGRVKADGLGAITSAIENASYPTGTTTHTDADVRLNLNDDVYELRAEEIENSTVTATITSSRNVLQNEAFDMFVMPYQDVTFNYNGNAYIASGSLSTKVASALLKDLDSRCYDMQLLPYCPIPEIIDEYGELDTDSLTENRDYDLIKGPKTLQTSNFVSGSMTYNSTTDEYTRTVDYSSLTDFKMVNYYRVDTVSTSEFSVKQVGKTIKIVAKTDSLEEANKITVCIQYTYVTTEYPVGIIFYPTNNRFKVDLDYSLELKHSMKVESQVDTYRLCSPNYQGSFDFNVAKNGGRVKAFHADCTYKPYTPYIRVYPEFEWLYGTDYSDCRGLICGGDFSIPRVTDAWQSYQLNNKNYQNIFNRDIQNLDFNNSIAMRNQIFSAATNVVGDAGKGAAIGSMAGPWGALAGAVVGAGASIVSAMADTDTLAKQQKEQRQLSIDKYNYQLGNIQALPYTLTKVGAFDINSKLFPFIEYYTASDEEIQALEDKIKYESMTVMRIGTIAEFKQDEPTYIKGQLIRLDDLHTDTNLINDIYTELYKGVYY